MSLPDPETTEAEAVTVDNEEVLGEISEDNPFRDVIVELREDGQEWGEIYDAMNAAFEPLDHAAFEESFVKIPEFEMKVVVADDKATSGERYETFTHAEATVEQANEWAESRPEVRRVEHIERVGMVTVG